MFLDEVAGPGEGRYDILRVWGFMTHALLH